METQIEADVILPMGAEEFRATVAAARLSIRSLAEWMGFGSHTSVQRIATGDTPVPPALAHWLRRRAADRPPQMAR